MIRLYKSPPPTPYATEDDWRAYRVVQAKERKADERLVSFMCVMMVGVIIAMGFFVYSIVMLGHRLTAT